MLVRAALFTIGHRRAMYCERNYMATSTVKEIMTAADVRAQLDTVIEHAQETKRPVIVTKNGKAAVVIVDAAQYQKEMDERDLLRGILEGEDAIRQGHVLS